jgi:hypothetical protein
MYKTIVLALLQDLPETYNHLCRNRLLLSAVNHWASQLKTRHEAWKERLAQAGPSTDESQMTSAALEMALSELEGSLTSTHPPNGGEPLPLESVMAFLRDRTSEE